MNRFPLDTNGMSDRPAALTLTEREWAILNNRFFPANPRKLRPRDEETETAVEKFRAQLTRAVTRGGE